MKKILIILCLMLFSSLSYARIGISYQELNTYKKLHQYKILDGDYDGITLNDPMSRIDIMSLSIKSIRYLDKYKLDQKKFIKFREYTYNKFGYQNTKFAKLENKFNTQIFEQDIIIKELDYEIIKLKNQARWNVLLWVLVGAAIVL